MRFTAQVALPNLIQGLFRRRKHASAIASRTGADGLAIGFLAGVKRSYGEGPVWIRVAKDETLLLLGRGPIRRVLPFMGGLDLSPFIALVAIQVIQSILVRLLPYPV